MDLAPAPWTRGRDTRVICLTLRRVLATIRSLWRASPALLTISRGIGNIASLCPQARKRRDCKSHVPRWRRVVRVLLVRLQDLGGRLSGLLVSRADSWLPSPRQHPSRGKPGQWLLVDISGTYNSRGLTLAANRPGAVTDQPTPLTLLTPSTRVWFELAFDIWRLPAPFAFLCHHQIIDQKLIG